MIQPPVQSEFTQFGPQHIAVIIILVLTSAVLCTTVRYMKSETHKRAIRYGLAAILLSTEWFNYGYTLTHEGLDYFLQNALPLHACGMAVYLTAFALITKNQLAFEITYFWGLAGTTQAIITPAITEGFPSIRFFQFFITHSAIILGVLVAVFGLKMRPRLKGMWITYALTWGLVFIVGGINALLDSNYMYLCHRPVGTSPFYFLNWPWYILFQGGIALILFFLLWLPFSIRPQIPSVD